MGVPLIAVPPVQVHMILKNCGERGLGKLGNFMIMFIR